MQPLAVVAVLLALAAVYAIVSFYHGKGKVVIYQGPAVVLCCSLLPDGRYSDTTDVFLEVDIPGRESMVIEVSQERMCRLTELITQVNVTIIQPTFGNSYITSVLWPGESIAEPVGA